MWYDATHREGNLLLCATYSVPDPPSSAGLHATEYKGISQVSSMQECYTPVEPFLERYSLVLQEEVNGTGKVINAVELYSPANSEAPPH